MNSVLVVMLCLFFVLSYKTCQSSSPQIVESPFVDGEDPNPGTPLFLTPLIENGKIEEAQKKAVVKHNKMGDVRSYSGYLTVNKEYNSNLFIWFFPAKTYTETAPVILWLQGGPGITSMFGLFAEHGPFIVTEDETLKKREKSWHKQHNIIYIDNPVGTGYSFTDNDKKGNPRNSTQVARDLHTALVQFFLLFPDLQNNDFFVAGESYAGKYVIALSHAIKTHNNIQAETKINLKGLIIGNGFCDPKNQLLYSDYLYQIGLIDLNGKTEFQKYENAIRQFIEKNDFSTAIYYYYALFGTEFSFESSLFYNLTGFHPDYHYLNANINDDLYFHLLWWFRGWIEKINVRYAIHVGNKAFNFYNDFVSQYQQEDYMKSVIFLLQDLIEHYRVLIYNGQTNIVNSYPLAANYLQKMQWSGAEKFAKATKKFWIVDGDIVGYIKSVDNLKFALIRNAGRMVSTDQPKVASDLIYKFTRNEEF